MPSPQYAKAGPFTDGGAPGWSAEVINPLETFLTEVNTAATDPAISSDGAGNETLKSIAFSVGGTISGTVGGNIASSGAHTISLPWNTANYRVIICPVNSATGVYYISSKTNTSVVINVPTGGNCDYLIICGV